MDSAKNMCESDRERRIGGAKDFPGPNVQSYHCIINLNRDVGCNTCLHIYI